MDSNFKKTLLNSLILGGDNCACSDLKNGDDKILYSDLLRKTLSLASYINNEFSNQENPRIVCITKRGPGALIPMIGILLSKGIYVPIDCNDPIERIKSIVEDAEPALIICDDQMFNVLGELKENEKIKKDLTILNHNEFNFNRPISEEVIESNINDPLYMIYTSGTTGAPKGVLVDNSSLIPLLNWINANTLAQESKKTLQFYSFGFDPSLLEIFSTLINGNELVMCKSEDKLDIDAIVKGIANHKINRIFTPISLIQAISELYTDFDALKTVTEINCGGDRMVITESIRHMLVRINELGCREVVLNNQYGPTEATIMVTNKCLNGDPRLWDEYPTIGGPVADTKLFVLDKDGAPLASGESGILAMSGSLLVIKPPKTDPCIIRLFGGIYGKTRKKV